jgi:ribonucleoside-diphosphate reductase beta chain
MYTRTHIHTHDVTHAFSIFFFSFPLRDRAKEKSIVCSMKETCNYTQNTHTYPKEKTKRMTSVFDFKPLVQPTRVDLLSMYHKARSSMWYEDEIQYTADLPDFDSMSPNERHFIELILGFFAVSDRIVLSNLVENFLREIELPEAKLFYNFQAVVEDVHSLTYTNHLLTLVRDPVRIEQLMSSISNFSSIAHKATWAIKWMDRSKPIEQRIIAFAVVEAVYFSASFCAIFWLKSMNKLVKGVGTSNEFIARDENLHADFACLLYKEYFPSVDDAIIHDIIRDAVEVEEEFVREVLPGPGFVGMTVPLMTQYVRFVADRLALQLGCKTSVWGVENPFAFMSRLSMPGKTNFFEKRVSEYTKVSSTMSSDDLAVLADF